VQTKAVFAADPAAEAQAVAAATKTLTDKLTAEHAAAIAALETRLADEKAANERALANKDSEMQDLQEEVDELLKAAMGADATGNAVAALEKQLEHAKKAAKESEEELVRMTAETKQTCAEQIKAVKEEAEQRVLNAMNIAAENSSEAAKIAAASLAERVKQAEEEATARHKKAEEEATARHAALQSAGESQLNAKLAELQESLSAKHAAELVEKLDAAKAAAVTETEERLEAEKEEMIEAMAQEVDELETTKDAEIAVLQKDLADTSERIAVLTRARMAAEDQLRKASQSNNRLKQNLAQVMDSVKTLQDSHRSLAASSLQQMTEFKQSFKGMFAGGLIGRLKSMQREMGSINERYMKEMMERKKLHNVIQELKGNIRVYMRCRPPLRKELQELGEDALCVSHPGAGEVRVFNEKNREKTWEFDETFDVNSTQEAVYKDVSGLVTSVMDGYNVCIFAYGQTGSGKTHTMAGPTTDRGVNWRALEDLFSRSDERRSEFRDVISLNILEVYNEEIRDLLMTHQSHSRDDKLEIRQGEFGNFVPGLTQREVTCLRDVEELFALAESNRATATTNMNEHSSRSHMMLTITVMSENLALGTVQRGKLNLVDLAGSERINKSGAAGQALKEAQNINKSLSALGDVIAARASKQTHIPFRNSTLTYLLQDSLSKDSKTLMICCISPLLSSAGETNSSLDFAARVRTVELGQATKNAATGDKKPSRR
jgi:kinesin family protein C2/C3